MSDILRKVFPAASMAAALLAALGTAPGLRAQTPATPVVVQTAAPTTLVESADAIGYVHADKEAPIRAEVADRIVKVHVKDGAKVAEGDVLFTLDDKVEKAQLKSAKTNHEVKQAALDRLNQLVKREVAAKSKVPEAEAEVVLAKVGVEQAELAVSQTKVRAPFDGVLGALQVEVGDYASSDETLATIYAPDPLQVRFRVPQRKVGRLAVGQPIVVWSSAFPEHRHNGRVAFINPALDPVTKSLEVRAVLDESGELFPGMFVSIAVTLKTVSDAITVPDEALVPTAKGFVVFLVEDGKARMAAVEVGLRDGNRVQITKGVAAGDQFVVEGQLKLRDGMPVAAAAPATAGQSATAAAPAAGQDAKAQDAKAESAKTEGAKTQGETSAQGDTQ